jgi:hypothetical protein
LHLGFEQADNQLKAASRISSKLTQVHRVLMLLLPNTTVDFETCVLNRELLKDVFEVFAIIGQAPATIQNTAIYLKRYIIEYLEPWILRTCSQKVINRVTPSSTLRPVSSDAASVCTTRESSSTCGSHRT